MAQKKRRTKDLKFKVAIEAVLPRMEMNKRLRYNKVDSPPKERIVWDSSVDVLVRNRR